MNNTTPTPKSINMNNTTKEIFLRLMLIIGFPIFLTTGFVLVIMFYLSAIIKPFYVLGINPEKGMYNLDK